MSDHAFHDAAQPMNHLKGGRDEAYVQNPMHSDNDMNRRPSADSPVAEPWTASLKAPAKGTSGRSDYPTPPRA